MKLGKRMPLFESLQIKTPEQNSITEMVENLLNDETMSVDDKEFLESLCENEELSQEDLEKLKILSENCSTDDQKQFLEKLCEAKSYDDNVSKIVQKIGSNFSIHDSKKLNLAKSAISSYMQSMINSRGIDKGDSRMARLSYDIGLNGGGDKLVKIINDELKSQNLI